MAEISNRLLKIGSFVLYERLCPKHREQVFSTHFCGAFLLPVINIVTQQHPSPGITVGETAATILILTGHIWEQICPILNNNKIGTESSNSSEREKGETEKERGEEVHYASSHKKEILHTKKLYGWEKNQKMLAIISHQGMLI